MCAGRGGQCTEITPYHLFANMELKQELGKPLLVFSLNLNQRCLVKDHQELGAAEGRKMLTLSSNEVPKLVVSMLLHLRALMPASEFIPMAWVFGKMGMGAGGMAEQGQWETALCLFIN